MTLLLEPIYNEIFYPFKILKLKTQINENKFLNKDLFKC
jgi:hypothetical protein